MFQKKNINELIARYELNFEDYPSSALQNRSTQDIKVAASNQSAADKSINAFSQISYFGQAHSHQNWAIIRQNEQIIRQNEQIINQNAGLAHQNQLIIDLLQQNKLSD